MPIRVPKVAEKITFDTTIGIFRLMIRPSWPPFYDILYLCNQKSLGKVAEQNKKSLKNVQGFKKSPLENVRSFKRR